MKKVIIFVVGVAFLASVSSVAFGRTLAEEKTAVQDYLKVIDAKIIKARKANQYAKTTMLKATKAATLARWNKLKASMEPAPVAPVVVAPVPPPAPVVVAKPFASAGALGLGINTELKGLWIHTGTGGLQGPLGLMGNLEFDDFTGLSGLIGRTPDAFKFKVGLGYYQGGGGLKAVPVFAGGYFNFPQLLGGQDCYVTGGLNYVVYGNGQTSGKIGGNAYFGLTADFGIGLGKTGFEVGYNVVRSNTVTAKGFSVAVTQPFRL